MQRPDDLECLRMQLVDNMLLEHEKNLAECVDMCSVKELYRACGLLDASAARTSRWPGTRILRSII